jgi:ankyrin repeat protein
MRRQSKSVANIDVNHDYFKAIREGNIDLIIKLIGNPDCVIDKTRWSGWTMLHRAAEEGQTKICQLLIESGAKINARTTWGWFTPLHLAFSNGWKDTVMFLYENGADITALSKCRKDPLQYGTYKGFHEISDEFRWFLTLKDVKANEFLLASAKKNESTSILESTE